MDNTKGFPANLKRARVAQGLTQTELASKVGVGHHFIKDLEAGRKSASVKTLGLLAKSLEVTEGYLLESGDAEAEKRVATPRLRPSDALRAYSSIPDMVVEIAHHFGPDHAVWTGVMHILEDRLNDIREEEAKKKSKRA